MLYETIQLLTLCKKHRLSAHSENEAGITLAMSANSAVTYLLCDSSKIGKESYFQFAPLGLVQVLITDKRIEELISIEKTGLKVLY